VALRLPGYGLAILLFPVAIRVSPLHFPLTMLY
jgi:hypothetical protein